jgi:hypothetical protein
MGIGLIRCWLLPSSRSQKSEIYLSLNSHRLQLTNGWQLTKAMGWDGRLCSDWEAFTVAPLLDDSVKSLTLPMSAENLAEVLLYCY